MIPNLESIPRELKVFPNWVLWKLENKRDKTGKVEIDLGTGKPKKTKVPYQVNGRKADSTDPKTWATFELVKEIFLKNKGKYNGIGFVFTEEAGIIGIDWDKVIDPDTGLWNEEVLQEVLSVGSYAEISQSETGAHAIVKGKIPGDRRRKGNIEMYCNERFFVVTGSSIEGTPKEIVENQEAIDRLYEKKFGKEKQTTNQKPVNLRSPDLTDGEVLQHCRAAGNKQKFIKLYDKGDISEYDNDESRADLALCSLLAFYTQKCEQIDRLFLGSKLYRDKWDRTDYKDRTINEVLSNQKEIFTGTKTKEEYSPELLKNTPIPENPREKLQIAKQFIKNYLMSLTISEAEEIIITDIKEHFSLSRDEIANLKRFYKELINYRHNRNAELSKNWNTDLNIDDEFEGLYTLHLNSEKTKVIDILLHFDKIALKVLESLNTIAYKGQIYVYCDGYYEDAEEIVMQEITRIINGIRKGRFSSGIKSCSANVLHNIQYFNPVTEYPFNKENAAIPVKNGIVLLDFENKTKKVIPHSSQYKFNYIIPTEYKEDADPKPINNILSQYSPDQVKELYQLPAQALMQMLGYGPFKKCYLLQGNRDAGKSSYIELLIRTFGTQNRCDVSLEMLNPKENKFALSSLEGKIFNIHDDMTYFSLKDTGTIKDLTGSYTKEIEKKGKQRYGADIRAVHCFACNKPPKYDGEIKKDIAFWERWVYIYFPNRFEKALTFYDENFTQENLSGFLNKVLDYVLEMGHDKKLVCNYSYADVRNTWAKCADPVFRFVSENMIPAETQMYYRKEDFLDLIKAWAKDQGEDEDEEVPATVTKLSQTIDICNIDKDAQITEEKTGIDARVYGIPYTWKEESIYKDKKQQVIPLKKQATLSN